MKNRLNLRPLAAVLALLLALLSLGGCAPSAEKIVERANENSQNANSANVLIHADIAVGTDGINLNMALILDMYMIGDPDKVKAVVTLEAFGVSMNVDYYTDEAYSYVGYGGSWTRSLKDVREETEEDGSKEPRLKDYTRLDDEELDGRNCYRIGAVITKEAIEEFAEDSGFGLKGPAEDTPVTLWIDKDSMEYVKAAVDFSDVCSLINFGEADDGIMNMWGEISLSKLDITAELKNFDGVEDFDIPEAALNAPIDGEIASPF